ncbi:DUF3768 domain-containing protein [Aquamicrobium lusatiense]|uniref:DUF3768 domain-containing protein n=1 Tax=Aquamicrobium lusatiense TaxID=89772 RepID=UPI0024590635|nr:DUF3768 domain-containing protein [Aquamicrobium lusatiense]MDH4992229.1 DUF3768 domain-containing protein [Aquamicrobium lusatiense]
MSASVAKLNDLLRTTFLTGEVVLTEGIGNLEPEQREAVITGVRTFDAFGENNDPYGERDFGAFKVEGVGTIFWKIDYYGTDYQSRSPDPADPNVTRRVLTIMLAMEY